MKMMLAAILLLSMTLHSSTAYRHEASLSSQSEQLAAVDFRAAVQTDYHRGSAHTNATEISDSDKLTALPSRSDVAEQKVAVAEVPKHDSLVQHSNQTEQQASAMVQTYATLAAKAAGGAGPLGSVPAILWQLLLVGLIWYLVVSKYPMLEASNDASKAIMQESPVFRCNLGPVCLQSWCCYPALIGLVADKVGILAYWPTAILSSCFPCCILMYLRVGTDLNVKLGGTKDEVLSACFLSCCCGCCSIARDADALCAATGSKLGFCSVESNVASY